MPRHNYSLRSRRPTPNDSTEAMSRGEKRAKSNPLSRPEIRSRYRGCCQYQRKLGPPGSPGNPSGRSSKQEDRIICDTTGLVEFCNQVLQHGYSGSKGGRGSRVESPNIFCENMKKGLVDIAAGDRVLVVFSRTFECRKLRVLEVVERERGGFCVRFTRPREICRHSFKAGYGSFSLAVIRAPGSTKEDFEFEEAEYNDAEDADDYVVEEEIEEEEENEKDDEGK